LSNQSLHRRLSVDPIELAVDAAQIFPPRRIVFIEGLHVEHRRKVDELALVRQLDHFARPRKTADVGRVPRFDAGGDHRVQIARSLEIDVDTGFRGEGLAYLVEHIGLLAAPNAEDRNFFRRRPESEGEAENQQTQDRSISFHKNLPGIK